MAKFTVKYRNKSGQIDFTEVDAVNRAAVFPVLKERGISPIMISEGAMPKRKGGGVGGGGGSHSSFGFIVIVILLLAVLGGLVWWFFFAGTGAKRTTKVADEKREAQEAKVEKQEASGERPAVSKIQKKQEVEQPVSEPVAGTPSKRSAEVETVTNDVEDSEPKKKTPTGTASDQLLMMAANLADGKAVPPMPIGPSATHDFKRSLEKEIVINEDDSEEVKKVKETLIQFRKDMLELTKDGRSVEAVLKEHQDMMNDNNKIRNDILKELRELREQGKEEDAHEYLTAMNAAIQQMGIKEIEMPKTEAEIEAEDEEEENQNASK